MNLNPFKTQELSNKKNTLIWLYIINILICIAAIVLLLTVWAPCPEGMKCRTTTCICIGIIAMICTLCIFNIKAKFMAMYLVEAAVSIGGILVTLFLGGCNNADMVCNQVTMPMIRLTFFALILMDILKIALYNKIQNKTDQDINEVEYEEPEVSQTKEKTVNPEDIRISTISNPDEPEPEDPEEEEYDL